MRQVQISVVFLAVMVLACSSAEPPGEAASERFRVAEQDGVTVATTMGGALHGGNVFTFEPVLRLRQDPQQPDSLLFNPIQLSVGPDGYYFVNDRGNTRIAVFDAEGNYVRAIGRGGDGPGEFGPQMVLESIVGDQLSIWQFHTQRLTRYRTDGTLLETVSIPDAGLMLGLTRDPSGLLVARLSNRDGEDMSGVQSWRVEVRDEVGENVLAEIVTGSVLTSVMQEIDVGGSAAVLSTSIPFAGSPRVQHVPGRGVLATDGDKPELLWYDLDGTLRRKVVLDLPYRPVTEAVKDDWLRRRGERRAQVTVNNRTQTAGPPSPPFPDTAGFWYWLFVDDLGYTWLLDVWAEEHRAEGDGWTFHVVDPEGRYLGVAELPASRPRVWAGRLMAIVEDPETEEMVPTVYSILPGDAGVEYPGSYRPGQGRH